MTSPTEFDWVNAARDIWNSDDESDVWVPESNDQPCSLMDKLDTDATIGAWVTGARVWVSRKQLDAYLSKQAGEGDGPLLPVITYVPAGDQS